MDIRGECCVVTGAARGIGRATSVQLAQRGGKVVLCDRRREEVDDLAASLRAQGLSAKSYALDVRDAQAVKRFADWVFAENMVAGVLVNNAGILRVGGFFESRVEDFQELFDVNLLGAVHMIRSIAPSMVARGKGAIVQVASASGRLGFRPLTAYSTSKFAVVGLTQALGAELRPKGVSVSAICPGLVRTEILSDETFSPEEKERYEAALGHALKPERVADRVVSVIKKGTPLSDVGWDARLMSWAARLAPNRSPDWAAKVAAWRSR